ncbi:TMEM175 family protein [Actinoplanes sp. NPDC051411]|uniref:TMEM175 family protein n=1 Tax=Actinoplanes sp. NPDC051411 TaxID=3155522 RepID=UPI00342C01DF
MDAREITTDEPDPRAIAAERLTFFADAVIAIAITLLALELPVPTGNTNHLVLHSLSANRGEYISFVISFYVIGFYWAHHHKVFRYVTVLGGRLVFLTLLWLFMLVLTPFATRMLSGDGGFQVRFVFYAIVQALAGLVWLLMVLQIQRNRLYRADTPPDLFKNAYFGTGGLAAGFLLSIPFAFFLSDYAYDLWIAVPIATALVGRRFFKQR